MIIVTGANGKLGRAVVEQLLKRVPAEQIGVSVRDPNQAQELQERGVRVRRGDFDDAESLHHAFEGASQVLIVSSGILGEAGIPHGIRQSIKQRLTRQRRQGPVGCYTQVTWALPRLLTSLL
ncbi:NAD(P)H-binding protein [Paenibacillus sp. P25]|nr:NAD(P)H-binding protein [Paenibacillus sp. P25]